MGPQNKTDKYREAPCQIFCLHRAAVITTVTVAIIIIIIIKKQGK